MPDKLQFSLGKTWRGVLFGIMVSLAVLFIYIPADGKEKSMNENVPENTLAVFTDNGKTFYLISIRRIPLETKVIGPNSPYGKATQKGDHGAFVSVTLMEGHYPENYTESHYFLLLIPENNIVRLKILPDGYVHFKKGKKSVSEDGWETGQWQDAGYSTDDSLWAKIFEYYSKQESKQRT